MQTVFTHGGVNPHGVRQGALIELVQYGAGRRALFVVHYGAQTSPMLTYAGACKELGAAIMHDLACEGTISNEGK